MVLLIRTDASAEIGYGHIMRCLALAQAWQDSGGKAVFSLAVKEQAVTTRLKSEGMEINHVAGKPGTNEDAFQTIDLARQLKASWIVVDGYRFGAEYQRIIKEAGFHLLLIDDLGEAEHYYADIVLNQNLHGSEEMYENRERYTNLLLGTRYALLRREFLRWQDWNREIPEVASKVLVTMGGGDPNNVTLKVIQALQRVKMADLEAVAVVGGGNPHLKELQVVARSSSLPIRLENKVTNMPELMAWADVAVSSSGSTCWELAFMGLPSLLLILADNQSPVSESLDSMRIAINLGWHKDMTSAEMTREIEKLLKSRKARTEMARCGQRLIDGEGTKRVLMPTKGKSLKLRQANKRDCKLVWEWANDPEVREASFSTEPIPWEEHVKWFESKLNDPRCLFYIAENIDSTPIGQVRFEIKEREATVSVSLDRAIRSKGYGSALIREATKKIFENTAVETIKAYIKTINEPSLWAFKKAGFDENGPTQVKGQSAIQLVMRRRVKK